MPSPNNGSIETIVTVAVVVLIAASLVSVSSVFGKGPFMVNLLLAFIVFGVCLPHFELPRPFNMVIAIILTVLAFVIAVWGGRIDLT